MKKIQLKHISDIEVCREVRRYAETSQFSYKFRVETENPFPYESIAKNKECSLKLAYRAMERAARRGYIEYGVSLRTGWLTDKGLALISKT